MYTSSYVLNPPLCGGHHEPPGSALGWCDEPQPVSLIHPGGDATTQALWRAPEIWKQVTHGGGARPSLWARERQRRPPSSPVYQQIPSWPPQAEAVTPDAPRPHLQTSEVNTTRKCVWHGFKWVSDSSSKGERKETFVVSWWHTWN